jgi:hypothetical protein
LNALDVGTAISPLPPGANFAAPTKSEKVAETIKAAIAANPFTSLSQLRKRLGEVFPFTLSRELLRVVIIKKQGLSKKPYQTRQS